MGGWKSDFAVLEGRGTEEIGFEWRTVNGIPELCGGYHLPRRGITSPVAAMAGIAAARIEFANPRPILAPLPAREDIAGATAVLLLNWPSVTALAEAVMERGKLSGDEAERIAMGTLPAGNS